MGVLTAAGNLGVPFAMDDSPLIDVGRCMLGWDDDGVGTGD